MFCWQLKLVSLALGLVDWSKEEHDAAFISHHYIISYDLTCWMSMNAGTCARSCTAHPADHVEHLAAVALLGHNKSHRDSARCGPQGLRKGWEMCL